ncbi:MAG: AAA family ATPase [Actinobacteria bacterium]|nr:AAA family ATPase [Actinomycetota bacterium]
MSDFTEGPVTLMFTDIEGSTDLISKLGDQAARKLFRVREDLTRDLIREHQGSEIKAFGDGFMIAFRSPRRAVECAVGIQRANEQANRSGSSVRLRIGINTGVVSEESGDLFGEAVNVAARIVERAAGGQILISEIVKQLVGTLPDVSTNEVGRVRLKGFPDRWRLFEVDWQPAPTPARLERTPFVGREEERDLLTRLMDEAISGSGSIVMIGGEPGVGKTRLASELGAAAESRSMLVFTGRSYETASAPYTPFIEILEQVQRQVDPEAFRTALGDAASEVARILPELRRMFPDIPQPIELPPEQERRFLLNSVRDFVARAAAAAPLYLLIDDVHWADESSLMLLTHLAESVAEMAALIVCTYRDVELDVNRPLARTLESLVRQRLAHRISLKRLQQPGVEQMLSTLSGQEPPPSLIKVIYEETEGNPFFVEEIFKHLDEEGRLFTDEHRFRPDLRIDELEVPEGVRLVIGRRLQRLDEKALKVLTAGAIIGKAFSYRLLETLADPAEEEQLLDSIDQARSSGLISEITSEAEPQFAFSHELIRQTLLSNVSLPRRQRLHLKVAEAIEKMAGDSPGSFVADIAHHFSQAGAAADPTKASEYLSLAGDRAKAAAAFDDALRKYSEALDIHPDDDALGRAQLLSRLGFAHQSLGQIDSALTVWREALDTFEREGMRREVGELSWHITVLLGWSGRWDESLEIAARGLGVTGEVATPERARLLFATAALVGLGGSKDAAEQLTAEGRKVSEELGDPFLAAYGDAGDAIMHFAFGEWKPCIADGLRAADEMRPRGALWDVATFLSFVANGLLLSADLERALVVGTEIEEISRRLGHWGALSIAHRTKGFLESRKVSPEEYLDGFERFVAEDAVIAARASSLSMGQNLMFHSQLFYMRGQWEEALVQLRRSLEFDRPGVFVDMPAARLLLMLARLGYRDEALAMIEERREQLKWEAGPKPIGTQMFGLMAIESLWALDEKQRAGELYPFAFKVMELGSKARLFDFRPVETIAGLSAAGARDWDKAERHLKAGIAQARMFGVYDQESESRQLYAEALLDRGRPGDREKALELLEEAIEMYRRVGMTRHLSDAEDLRERI